MFTFPNIDPNTANNDTNCSPPQSLNPSFYSTPTAGLATAVPYSFPTLPSSASTGYQVSNGPGLTRSQVSATITGIPTSAIPPIPIRPWSQPWGSLQREPIPRFRMPRSAQPGWRIWHLSAGVIYAAQASLAPENAKEVSASPTPQPINIMIVLSDGNTNASPATEFRISSSPRTTPRPMEFILRTSAIADRKL